IQGWLGTGITDKKMGDHHLPHELSRLSNCCEETLPTRMQSATEKLILKVIPVSFPEHPVDMDNFSDFRK
ncbi:hypothetical protein ACVS3Q_000001, partial [Escherichia coli]